jgi:hypothetical protein
MLETGWCAYAWDMKHKVIFILDPMAASPRFSDKKKIHESIADKLHVALFTCLYQFYSSWHVDCGNWKKRFEIYSIPPFTK